MQILGIETSCDDTSVSVVNADRTILSNQVISKLEEHQLFGGVVPEIASRNHLATLPSMLAYLDVDFNSIDAIAVTQGPGLIGGLIVGVMVAKALSYALSKPIIPINHLEGHLLTNRLVHKDLPYPFLSLLVSGGHCQFILAHAHGKYEIIGHTLDDAVGEAFDKVAKMMDLKYPGGPKIEQIAKNGDPYRHQFPMPLIKSKDCNLSFSGLKTAVKRKIDSIKLENNGLTDQDKANIAASFQYTVGEILSKKLQHAIFIAKKHGIKHFAVCGGVSANQYICQILKAECATNDFAFYNAPLTLCVDNAAMIAWAGIEQLISHKDKKNSWQNLTFAPQSTLNLE